MRFMVIKAHLQICGVPSGMNLINEQKNVLQMHPRTSPGSTLLKIKLLYSYRCIVSHIYYIYIQCFPQDKYEDWQWYMMFGNML